MRISLVVILMGLFISTPAFAGPVGDAAKKGDVAEIETLLAAGADANEPDTIASPLHWAAMNGHTAAVRLLVANGANLEAQSSMLGTPLHAASRFGREAAIKELLEAGTDPDVRDRDGFTSLMKAVIENRRAAVEALLIGGANVDAVLNGRGGRGVGRGQTIALQLAIQFGRSDIADILRAAGAGAIPPDVPAQLLANGDPERGREFVYQDCDGCHTVAAGDPPRSKTDGEGPPLIGVIGRSVANLTDFDYSDALIAYSGTWTPERFYAFALSPALTVPGTLMHWSFDRTPELVADITAYFVSEAE